MANVVKPGLDHLNSLLRPDYTSLNFDKFTKRGRVRLDKVIIPNIAVTFGPFGFASALLSAKMWSYTWQSNGLCALPF